MSPRIRSGFDTQPTLLQWERCQGYATEAACTYLDFGFEHSPCDQVGSPLAYLSESGNFQKAVVLP